MKNNDVIFKYIDPFYDQNELEGNICLGHKINPDSLVYLSNLKFDMIFVAIDIDTLNNCYLDHPKTFIKDLNCPTCTFSILYKNNFVTYHFNIRIYN